MTFQFWVKYLQVTSLFFAAMGVFWAIAGTFDPLGIWDAQLARTFFNQDQLPLEVAQTKAFILGPFGATAAGYFILQFSIAKYAYAQRQLWAYQAIVVGFSVWFILDSIMSAAHGAYFNILLANIPSLLLMLPIFFTRPYFKEPPK